MRSRLLIGCLLTAVAVINVVCLMLSPLARGYTVPTLALFGLSFAQTGLAASWLIMSRWNVLLRIGLLLASVALFASPIDETTHWQLRQAMGVLTVFAVVAALPLLIVRFRGWNLIRPGREPGESTAASPSQFTLVTMMTLITALAILLAAIQLMEFPWHVNQAFAIFALGQLIIVWMAIGTVMMEARLGIRVLLALSVIPIGRMLFPGWSAVVVPALPLLLSLVCLSVLHLAGYRLRRTAN